MIARKHDSKENDDTNDNKDSQYNDDNKDCKTAKATLNASVHRSLVAPRGPADYVGPFPYELLFSIMYLAQSTKAFF